MLYAGDERYGDEITSPIAGPRRYCPHCGYVYADCWCDDAEHDEAQDDEHVTTPPATDDDPF